MDGGIFRGPFSDKEPDERIAERISVDEVKARMDRGEKFSFVDVRDEAAWDKSGVKIASALRIPLEEVEQRLGELPHGRPVVAYCA
jgi:rhodanese-related sulfurtransferase